jgi:hypothetical protein
MLEEFPSGEKRRGILRSGYVQRVMVALDPGVFELLM